MTSKTTIDTTSKTTIAAPMTAAEARRIADELTAAERNLTDRRRAASKAARITTAEHILEHDAPAAAAERDNAITDWNSLADDAEATIEQLVAAFTRMRCASAARAALVAQAGGILDDERPTRNEISGQPQRHRNDTQDYLARETFGTALEGIIARRADNAAATARDATQNTVNTASADAEQSIQ